MKRIYDEFSSFGRNFNTSSLGRAPPKMLAVWLVGARAAGGAPTDRGRSWSLGRAAASSKILERLQKESIRLEIHNHTRIGFTKLFLSGLAV